MQPATEPGRLVLVMPKLTTHRLVIGIFDHGGSLRQAGISLADLDVGPAQLCLVAPTGRLRRLAQQAGVADRAELLEGLSGTDPSLVTSTDKDGILTMVGTDWARAALSSFWSNNSTHPHSWMTGGQRASIVDYVQRGAAVLAVSANSAIEHRAATRALLRHSSHRVWTHEFVT